MKERTICSDAMRTRAVDVVFGKVGPEFESGLELTKIGMTRANRPQA